VQLAHVVISEQDVNIHVICVRTAPCVTHNKLPASVRLDGLNLPAISLVLR